MNTKKYDDEIFFGKGEILRQNSFCNRLKGVVCGMCDPSRSA